MEDPTPLPSLVYYRKEDDFMTFCPIGGESDVKKVPLEFLNKDIRVNFGCNSWSIVWTEDGETQFSFSLWNFVTMEDPIYFPKLNLKPEQKINHPTLTTTPGNPNCMLVLFATTETEGANSLIYCRVEDENWTEQVINVNGLSMWNNPVMCNGKIYCYDSRDGKLMIVDIKRDCLDINFSDEIEKHGYKSYYERIRFYMVESCGDLFRIILFFNGNQHVGWFEVCAVEVYKLDSQAGWHYVETFEDRAFFLSPSGQFSHSTTDRIKGNQIYFTLDLDDNLYAFNIINQTITFSMPLPTKPKPEEWYTTFWLVVDPSPRSKENLMVFFKRTIYKNINLFRGALEFFPTKVIEIQKFWLDSDPSPPSALGDFDNFPLELLSEIGNHLQLSDFMNFRAVNTLFKSAAPLNKWTKSVLEGFEGNNMTSAPLLMSRRTYKDVWKFIDPLHKEICLLYDYNKLEDAVMCYSKGGWCVIMHGESSILLWNPFTDKTIPFPSLPLGFTKRTIAGCSFSSPPEYNSPKSNCTIVFLFNFVTYYFINFINLGDEEWQSRTFKSNNGLNTVARDNSPILYKGAFYFLDEMGNLGVYALEEEEGRVKGGNREDRKKGHEVLDHLIPSPCESFHQKFLLECNGMLLSIFVGFLGRWVDVFKFDKPNLTWSDISDIGDHTLYLSLLSSFSMKASPGMRNRIYFSRYYGKSNAVYYSLESEMLHSHDTGKVLEDFYDTKEQLLCGWFTPTI